MQCLQDILLPFQKEGHAFGLAKHGKCLIADEMGLGKTIQGVFVHIQQDICFQMNVSPLQAISIASAYMNEWPMLVVCPSSMKYAWANELEKWLPELEPGQTVVIIPGPFLFAETFSLQERSA